MTLVWSILIAAAVSSFAAPLVETYRPSDWAPRFSEPAEVQLTQDTVALATHSSQHFDPLRRTAAGLNRVVHTMKQRGLPVLYLHDQYNTNNPAWLYLYRDWQPTAYLKSDIGHFDVDFSAVRHVVCLGGFYTLCERNTVADAVRLWLRDAGQHDLRLTQVVDGVFDLGDGVQWSDPYRPQVRQLLYDRLRVSHPDAVMSLADVLKTIPDNRLAVDYVKRQLPAVPPHVTVCVDYFGQRVVIRPATQPEPEPPASDTDEFAQSPAVTLTFAYRTSFSFLAEDSRR